MLYRVFIFMNYYILEKNANPIISPVELCQAIRDKYCNPRLCFLAT